MKILVREYANGICNYVWKKIKMENPFYWGGYDTEDGMSYNQCQVLKITHDIRNGNYVMCSNCGKVVKRNSLTLHYEKGEAEANCMKCSYLRIGDASTVTNKLRSDGMCIRRTVGVPNCGYRNYRVIPIATIDKVEKCKYFGCRRSEARELPTDFLAEHPGAYDRLLTENAAITGGWKYLSQNSDGRQYANKDGKVVAYFDTNGILIHFILWNRSSRYTFTYSDVYDKFIPTSGVLEFNWGGIAEARRKRYEKQIRALYR